MWCKRITRSVLASELYVKIYDFDQSYVLKKATEDFIGRSIPLWIYADFCSKLGPLSERIIGL